MENNEQSNLQQALSLLQATILNAANVGVPIATIIQVVNDNLMNMPGLHLDEEEEMASSNHRAWGA